MTTTREEGYYWVTWGLARRILEYYGGKWWITSNRWADEEALTDINENRIIETMTTDKKWYAVQYENGYWNIQSNPGRGDGIERSDITSPRVVGKEQAEKNAKLCAAAPEMRQLIEDMGSWLEELVEAEDLKIRNKLHPIHRMIEQYRKLEKQLQ